MPVALVGYVAAVANLLSLILLQRVSICCVVGLHSINIHLYGSIKSHINLLEERVATSNKLTDSVDEDFSVCPPNVTGNRPYSAGERKKAKAGRMFIP